MKQSAIPHSEIRNPNTHTPFRLAAFLLLATSTCLFSATTIFVEDGGDVDAPAASRQPTKAANDKPAKTKSTTAKPGPREAFNSPQAFKTVLDKILPMTLRPPLINTNPGSEYDDDVRNYAMASGGIERTPKGRLWALWASGGDSQHAYLVAASSDDGGRTWSTLRLVIDPPDAPNPDGLKISTIIGNLWTDPLGRLWLFFSQTFGYFDGRAGTWASICENPDSDNPVWSEPQRIWHGFPMNKPVVLSNGEWLLPVLLHTRNFIRSEVNVLPENERFPGFSDLFPELDHLRMANCLVSTDQGKTWTRRGGAAADERRFDEHTLVELKDGRLWMLIRTNYGLAESYSPDFGKTWSEPMPSPITHTPKGSRVFLRRLASGGILLVKHGQIDERIGTRLRLTAFVSHDEGKTWGTGLLLDERVGASYPDGFQAPDGSIYILHDYGRATQREMLLQKFTEEDIKQGAFNSQGSLNKHLVNKARGPYLPAKK